MQIQSKMRRRLFSNIAIFVTKKLSLSAVIAYRQTIVGLSIKERIGPIINGIVFIQLKNLTS